VINQSDGLAGWLLWSYDVNAAAGLSGFGRAELKEELGVCRSWRNSCMMHNLIIPDHTRPDLT
jgi:hypothetical protein